MILFVAVVAIFALATADHGGEYGGFGHNQGGHHQGGFNDGHHHQGGHQNGGFNGGHHGPYYPSGGNQGVSI